MLVIFFTYPHSHFTEYSEWKQIKLVADYSWLFGNAHSCAAIVHYVLREIPFYYEKCNFEFIAGFACFFFGGTIPIYQQKNVFGFYLISKKNWK